MGCTDYDGAAVVAAAAGGGIYQAIDCFNANDAYDGGILVRICRLPMMKGTSLLILMFRWERGPVMNG